MNRLGVIHSFWSYLMCCAPNKLLSRTFVGLGLFFSATGCCEWTDKSFSREKPGLMGCLNCQSAVMAVEFVSDGELVSAENSGVVKFWDLATGGTYSEIKDTGAIRNISVPSPGGPVIAAGLVYLSILDPRERRDANVMTPYYLGANTLAVSPDGRYVICGGDGHPSISIFDINNWKLLANSGDYSETVCSVDISADGTTAISGGFDDAVRIWAVPSGKPLAAYKLGSTVYDSVAISPDGRLGAALGHFDRKLRLFKVADGAVLETLSCSGRWSRLIRFTPDGRRLIYADGLVLRVWDIPAHKQIAAFTESRSEIISIAVSPDGRTVAAGSGVQSFNGWAHDTVVRVWRLP